MLHHYWTRLQPPDAGRPVTQGPLLAGHCPRLVQMGGWNGTSGTGRAHLCVGTRGGGGQVADQGWRKERADRGHVTGLEHLGTKRSRPRGPLAVTCSPRAQESRPQPLLSQARVSPPCTPAHLCPVALGLKHVALGQLPRSSPSGPHVHGPVQPSATPKPPHPRPEPPHRVIPHRLLDEKPEAPLLGEGCWGGQKSGLLCRGGTGPHSGLRLGDTHAEVRGGSRRDVAEAPGPRQAAGLQKAGD